MLDAQVRWKQWRFMVDDAAFLMAFQLTPNFNFNTYLVFFAPFSIVTCLNVDTSMMVLEGCKYSL